MSGHLILSWSVLLVVLFAAHNLNAQDAEKVYGIIGEAVVIPCMRFKTIITSNKTKYENTTEGVKIYKVDQNDLKKYDCADPEEVFELESGTKPVLKSNFDAQTFFAGDTMKLECGFEATPVVTVSWVKNGVNISQETASNVQIESVAGADKKIVSSLTITNLALNDTGKYGCIGRNVLGFQKVENDIKVYSNVTFLHRPLQNYTAIVNGKLSMVCRVQGHPLPVIVWRINGNVVKSGNRYTVTTIKEESKYMVNSVFEISPVQLSDTGEVTCEAIATFSEINASSFIQVHDAPKIDQIYSLKQNIFSIPIQWNLTGSTNPSLIQHYIISYQAQNTTAKVMVKSSNMQYLLTNLEANSTHQICASLVDLLNIRSEAVCFTATTLPFYELEMLDLTVFNVTSTSISLRWNRKTKLEHVDVNHFVVIEWVLKGSTGKKSTEISAKSNAFFSTRKFDGLKPNSEYEFIVYQKHGKHKGPINKYNGVTEQGRPSKPQNIFVSSSETSLDIKWDEPAMPNGDIIDYKVTYKFQKSMNETESKSVTAKELNVKLDNLYPGVSYEIEISARTGPGYGEVATTSAQTTEGKPQAYPENLSTTPLNSTTLIASWTSIPKYLQGGTLRQIIITWEKVSEAGDPKEQYLSATATSFAISGLEAYTAYTITISATTDIGKGPVKELVVTTPEGTPTKPLDLSGEVKVHSPDEQSILLSWVKPKNENGLITRAQVVYQKIAICTSLKCKRSLKLNEYHYDNVTANVQDRQHMIDAKLDPFSRFGIKVREGTSVGWGEYSDEITVSTIAGRPSEPVNVTLGESTHDSIFIEWEKPRKENGIIQHYYIYTHTGSQLVDKATLKVTDTTPLEYIIKQNIEPSTSYSIQVFAETNCNCGEGIGSRPLPVLTPVGPAKFPWLLVLVGVLVVVLFIAVVIAIILLVKRRKQKYKEVKQEDISMANVMRSKPVLVDELKYHCMQQHANSDHGFQQEFEAIRLPASQFTWEHSQMPANQSKNRYSNIVAYDRTRVVLSVVDGVLHSDYINANYIDGYKKPKKYIATQGPLPETVIDFWRMVWEQEVTIIVMLTKLVEDSRAKCEQYWPEGKGLQYGNIVVTVESVSEMTDYTVRMFTLHKFNEPHTRREVHQYHYKAWPDHGVPSHPTSLLSFIRHVMSVMDSVWTPGPIIVHCSAGVGRTGTFIGIETGLRQAAHENVIDVFACVYNMRKCRNFMVQVESQYTLIYDALLDNHLCGNTEISPSDLISTIHSLNKEDPQTGQTLFAAEFKRLETGLDQKNDKNQFSEASHAENKHKNRFLNILPYDKNRVRLSPIAGQRNSDYINSSFIDGFQQKNAFIATQAPLENTVNDFWRMIFEQGIHSVVMLTKIEERGQEKCYLYWPQAGTVSYGAIHVELMNVREETDKNLVINELRLTNREDGRSWPVTHYMYMGWPEYGSPESGVELIRLIGMIQETEGHKDASSGGPILVHCSGGVGRTGVFMAVFNSIERLKANNVVDIFHTVRALRLQRTAMVQTIDQYMFCYQCLLDYLNSFHLYANSVNA